MVVLGVECRVSPLVACVTLTIYRRISPFRCSRAGGSQDIEILEALRALTTKFRGPSFGPGKVGGKGLT